MNLQAGKGPGSRRCTAEEVMSLDERFPGDGPLSLDVLHELEVATFEFAQELCAKWERDPEKRKELLGECGVKLARMFSKEPRWARFWKSNRKCGYIRKILHNLHIDSWKRSRRSVQANQELVDIAIDDRGGEWSGYSEEVQMALASLDEREQQVVRMAYWEGLQHAEIGVRLGITATNSRVLLHRACKRLRGMLAEFA